MNPGRKTSLINEIVTNLVVLMVAATALISFTVLWTSQLQGLEEKYTPLILVLYVILFAVVIVVFGTLFLSRVMVKPLKKLLDATEKISRGNFDIQVAADSGDELGQLAGAFNSMAEELAKREQSLALKLKELEQTNRELQKTQDQLIVSEKMASVGKLAAGVAHEIGNPLSIISGCLETLSRSKNLGEREKDLAGRAEGELWRINQIIRELLEYSRPASAELEAVDLNAVITETLKLLEVQKGFSNIETRLELTPGLPLINAGRNQLKQVLVNVFLNALDAMPVQGTLKLRTYATSGNPREVVAEVTDSGKGMPREIQSKIFDPFFTTKEPGKGVGLGLSISLKLMAVMKGRIEVESEPGQGSTFRLRFRS